MKISARPGAWPEAGVELAEFLGHVEAVICVPSRSRSLA